MPRSLRSPALIRKRRKRIFFRVFPIVAIGTLCILGPIFLLRASFLQIDKIEVRSSGGILKEEATSIVENNLVGNFLFVIPRRSIFFYPKQRIRDELQQNFPRIENLNIDLQRFSALVLELSLRKPTSLWCRGTTKEDCFFIDDQGFVFDKAGEFSDGIYFIYRGLLGEGSEDPLGKQYLDTNNFVSLKDFVGKARDIGLLPKGITPIGNNSWSLIVLGGNILFSSEDDFSEVLANLGSLLSDEKLSLVKDGELQVASIDLRYGKKVILKKKEEIRE